MDKTAGIKTSIANFRQQDFSEISNPGRQTELFLFCPDVKMRLIGFMFKLGSVANGRRLSFPHQEALQFLQRRSFGFRDEQEDKNHGSGGHQTVAQERARRTPMRQFPWENERDTGA